MVLNMLDLQRWPLCHGQPTKVILDTGRAQNARQLQDLIQPKKQECKECDFSRVRVIGCLGSALVEENTLIL